MYARGVRLWSLSALSCILAIATFRCSSNDALGTSAAAVNAGHDDTDDPFRNASVLITGNNGRCTGTLVTARRVLTANHCITGAMDNSIVGFGQNNSNVTVSFGPDRTAFHGTINNVLTPTFVTQT